MKLGGVPGNRYELWCIATDGRWVSGGFGLPAGGGGGAHRLGRADECHRLVVTPEGRRAPTLMPALEVLTGSNRRLPACMHPYDRSGGAQ